MRTPKTPKLSENKICLSPQCSSVCSFVYSLACIPRRELFLPLRFVGGTAAPPFKPCVQGTKFLGGISDCYHRNMIERRLQGAPRSHWGCSAAAHQVPNPRKQVESAVRGSHVRQRGRTCRAGQGRNSERTEPLEQPTAPAESLQMAELA